MKTNLLHTFVLSCVFCLTSIVCKAQTTWCPAGAEWHYGWHSGGDVGYVHYRYNKDTVFQNRTCHQIESTRYRAIYNWGGFYQHDTSDGGNTYTYSSNDTVYFYYALSNQWLPLYYFNAQVGDTLNVAAQYYSNDSVIHAIVDSAGIVQIDSQNLRYYVFHFIEPCPLFIPFSGKVIERIGIIDNDFFPGWHCVTDDLYYSFRCYQDSSFALYPANSVNCDYNPTGFWNCQPRFTIYPDTATPGTYYGYNLSNGPNPLSYLWDFGDGNTSTLPYPSHTYAQPGQYYICLTVTGTGCSNTDCDSSYLVFKNESGLMSQLIILNPLGIFEITTPTFSLSPNPASNSVTITIEETMLSSTATITDITGRKVAAAQLQTLNYKLETANFANGVYFISIENERGRVTKKLMIQK